MANSRVHIIHIIIALLAIAVSGCILVSEIVAQSASSKTSIRLLDELGPRLGSEERSARFDMLFSELGIYQEPRKDETSIGHVLIYCGKVCRYGEVEAHIRGIQLKMHARKVPSDRIKIVAAGYRDQVTVELWIAPDGQMAPVPRSTVTIDQVRFTKTTTRIVEAYDCCDDPNEVWDFYLKNKRIN